MSRKPVTDAFDGRPRRLLVAVAELSIVEDPTHPRRYLLELLRGLRQLGVEIQVMAFDEGPALVELEEVASVHLARSLRHRSPGGLLQSIARRLGGDRLADRVEDVRLRRDRRWIHGPDGIHVHGPLSARILSYVRDLDVPITTYSHPWDFSIAGLTGRERRGLVERSQRFLVANDAVVADLTAAGADPAKIELAPDPIRWPPSLLPTARTWARTARGLPIDSTIVGLLPVPDWVDAPDQTLPLIWEVERRVTGPGPLFLWPGMPAQGEPRWSIDFDATRMGLRGLEVRSDEIAWAELLVLCDLVVLPQRSATSLVPSGFAEHAARNRVPVLCWQGHPQEAEVDRWGGHVVGRAEVGSMADLVAEATSSIAGFNRVARRSWSPQVEDIEQVTPLRVPTRVTSDEPVAS